MLVASAQAVRRRLRGNLPTSVYNPLRAKREHGFIDLAFRPYGRANPNDTKGNVPGEVNQQEIQRENVPLTGSDPNSIKIRVPALSSQSTRRDNTSTTPLTDSLPDPIQLRVSVPGGLPLVGSGPNSPNGRTLMCSAESVQDVYSGSPLASGDPDSLGGHAPVCLAVNVRGVECNTDGLLLTSSGPDSLGSCVPMHSATCVQDVGHNAGGLPVCSAVSTQEAGSIV